MEQPSATTGWARTGLIDRVHEKMWKAKLQRRSKKCNGYDMIPAHVTFLLSYNELFCGTERTMTTASTLSEKWVQNRYITVRQGPKKKWTQSTDKYWNSG